MNPDLHWWVWLLAGIATGLLPIFGEIRLLGLLQVLIVISSPVVIFMNAGTAYLPFVLFYGGLMVVSSFLFKRKTAQEDAKRKESLEAKKKSWS